MNALSALRPEWQRLGLLRLCVLRSRLGEPLAELESALPEAQQRVDQARNTAQWLALAGPARLDAFDQDILACVAAPEAEPALGRAFQDLQAGVASPFPTPALIHELLFLGSDELPALHARLGAQARLQQQGLIEHGGGAYQPVLPGARTRSWLLGDGTDIGIAAPPGTVEWPVRAGWDELVTTPQVLAGLQELVLWQTQRSHLEHAWGARLGGGPVALFAGPSGTGKTLAAEVLARALGCRLLAVDLGRLVSKYIGETEKNLNAVFDAAAGQPVVLLFDEADALFGRRAEVRDARDRYANLEVSHLLSRIERHQGPCVLTSNLRGHLDPAFVRRFHVVVEFTRPGPTAREALWQLHLPPRAPRDPDLQPALLAQAAALTGAQIRNAAHRAALLSAADAQPLSLRHAALAIWRELAKDGRELGRESLGALAPHLPQEA